MKCILVVITVFFVMSGFASRASDSINNSEGVIFWESSTLTKVIDNYKKVTPIRFEGRNTSSREIKILAVKADCSACSNPKASVDVVGPGQAFTVHGMVKLNSANGLQRGSIVVVTQDLASLEKGSGSVQEVPYTLSYEISFKPPFSIAPDRLSWGLGDLSPKELNISFDASNGYNYLGYYVSQNSYKVVETTNQLGSVTLTVTPLVTPAPADRLEVSYKVGGPSGSGAGGSPSSTTTTIVPLGS